MSLLKYAIDSIFSVLFADWASDIKKFSLSRIAQGHPSLIVYIVSHPISFQAPILKNVK